MPATPAASRSIRARSGPSPTMVSEASLGRPASVQARTSRSVPSPVERPTKAAPEPGGDGSPGRAPWSAARRSAWGRRRRRCGRPSYGVSASTASTPAQTSRSSRWLSTTVTDAGRESRQQCTSAGQASRARCSPRRWRRRGSGCRPRSCAGSCAATSRPARGAAAIRIGLVVSSGKTLCTCSTSGRHPDSTRARNSAAGPGARMPSRAPASRRSEQVVGGAAELAHVVAGGTQLSHVPRHGRSRRTARTRRRRCVRRAHACQCPPVSTSAPLASTDGSDAASARDAAARRARMPRSPAHRAPAGGTAAGRGGSAERWGRSSVAVGHRRGAGRDHVMTRPSRRASSRSSRWRCAAALPSTKPHRAQSSTPSTRPVNADASATGRSGGASMITMSCRSASWRRAAMASEASSSLGLGGSGPCQHLQPAVADRLGHLVEGSCAGQHVRDADTGDETQVAGDPRTAQVGLEQRHGCRPPRGRRRG